MILCTKSHINIPYCKSTKGLQCEILIFYPEQRRYLLYFMFSQKSWHFRSQAIDSYQIQITNGSAEDISLDESVLEKVWNVRFYLEQQRRYLIYLMFSADKWHIRSHAINSRFKSQMAVLKRKFFREGFNLLLVNTRVPLLLLLCCRRFYLL